MDDAVKHQITKARGKFIAMAGAYALGAFNDNFFKTVAMTMALSAKKPGYAGATGYLFALPFVLFAAYCGWLADRFPKRRIVIASKIMELIAMCVAAVGIMYENHDLLLVTIFIMGSQAAIFGPALNGSIPELYPASFVPAANARLKVATTMAILLGVAASGIALGVGEDSSQTLSAGGNSRTGLTIAAVSVVVVAALGVLASLWVVGRKAADPTAVFPRTGPVQTMIDLARLHRDKLLAKILWADAFIWGLGSLQVMIIFQIGQDLGLGKTKAGILAFSELAGIAVGGMLVVKMFTGPRWYRLLPVCSLVIGLLAVLVGAVPAMTAGAQFYILLGLLLPIGIAGGMFMIPCESFIQVRPGAQEKGLVIAAGNFMAFSAIIISSLLYALIGEYVKPKGTEFFAWLAAAAVPVAVVLLVLLRREAPAEWQEQQAAEVAA